MNTRKKDITSFLLLAAVALLILFIDIPRFNGETIAEDGGKIFAGDEKTRLADVLSGNNYYEGAFKRGSDTFSSCDVSPRLAILRFEPFDMNRADMKTLSFIRGIGPKLASRIIAKREEVGGFRKIDDLLDVRGIGPSKLKALKEGVVVCP